MKIVDVRPVLMAAPYGFAGAQASRRSACLVEVETDDGIIGIGEICAGVYVPELAAAIVSWFKQRSYFASLFEVFEQLGCMQGKIEPIHRFPDEKPEQFQSMAAEQVGLAPAVLVGVGGAAPYVKSTTSTIPMVLMYV